jgi:hypothetical protein
MSRNRRESYHPTVEEAVETLSNIASIDFDQEVAEVDPLNVSDNPSYRAVQWLKGQDAESTVKTVRESFRVILNYLKNFYTREYHAVSSSQAIEGIKDIMVLVGEAAKKLDKYMVLAKQSEGKEALTITQLKEYKKLQEFYLTRIARKVDESVLSNWIMGLSRQIFAAADSNKPLQSLNEGPAKHIFIDLDSVKKDTEYELFFIRKEDGTHFFSPRLIRNMKLVSDFGNYLGEQNDEVLESIDIWRMQALQLSANNILSSLGSTLDQFYHELKLAKDAKDVGQLEKLLSQALMALMLASNAHHLSNDSGVKNCAGYFVDFQRFLRQALNCHEYQKYLAYPPSESNTRAHAALEMAHALCENLFTRLHGSQKLQPAILQLLQEAGQKQSLDHGKAWAASQLLSDRLVSDYVAMTKLLKGSSHGPLVNVLASLEEGSAQAYDPLFQGNIPNCLYSFEMDDKHIDNVRIPAPIHQEFIDKPVLTEEFKGCLRGMVKKNKTLLLFNLQDKTSWREHARAVLLEELQKNPEFENTLTVVTFAKDTEFYHQLAPYFEDNHAHTFIKQFKEHLADESCGFSFPEHLRKAIFPKFIDGVIESIHRVFFGGKNVLLRAQRMDFIEIFYLFLQIKLIEVVHPDTVSFTCKDGVDVGIAASAQLYLFLNWLNDENFTKEGIEQLYLMLYAPVLVNRERTMLPVVFNRMQKAMRVIELVRRQQGWEAFAHNIQSNFSPYFKTSWMIDVA